MSDVFHTGAWNAYPQFRKAAEGVPGTHRLLTGGSLLKDYM